MPTTEYVYYLLGYFLGDLEAQANFESISYAETLEMRAF